MHNLFIIYHLDSINDNGDRANRACQTLGNSTPLFDNCWYINSPYDSQVAIKKIGGAFGPKDQVVIINTLNDSCTWLGIGEKEALRVQQNWNMKLSIDESIEQTKVSRKETEEESTSSQ